MQEADCMKPADGRDRVVIEAITPQIEGGRYPASRIIGDVVNVTAAIFADGHDHLAARLLYRHNPEDQWRVAQMREKENDLWIGTFKLEKLGMWSFSIEGWIDHFDTWVSDLKKRLAAQREANDTGEEAPKEGSDPQEIPLALRSGAILLQDASKRAGGADATQL